MLRLPTRPRLAALLLVAVVVAGCSDDDDDRTTARQRREAPANTSAPPQSEGAGDVLETAARERDLETFLAATEAAGIMDGLHGPGPFTVFAPTDDAFAQYLEQAGMTQGQLFSDQALLRRVVQHHIVNQAEDADMVMSMSGRSFTTAAGTPLQVSVDGDTVMVGEATVQRYDIEATNGVIHVIDGVLIPPGS